MTHPGFALLKPSRARLAHFSPSFEADIAAMAPALRESRKSPAVRHFKEGGPLGLLIPQAAGGLGASALDAVHVQIALGAVSPSLAVATTMHQFSVASLLALVERGGGSEALLLRAIAEQRLLLSSGFAEGVPGRGILDSSMSVSEGAGGRILISGTKKPCSLSESMDLLTASYTRPSPQGDELMVALVPANGKGLTRRPYWVNPALAGAQSEELVLDCVEVTPRMVFSAGLKTRLDDVQVVGFVWFELLMSASYLGACAGLVEQVVERGRWNDGDRAALGSAVQLSMSALFGFAHEFDRRHDAGAAPLDDMLARLLLIRYGVEAQLAQASDAAHEMLGGNAFIASEESSIRLLAARGLRFHPPARISMQCNLAAYLRGEGFSMTTPGAPASGVGPAAPTAST